MHKKLYLPVILLLLLTVGLELLNIHLSGILASNSTVVRQLQTNIAKLDEENQILNSKVLAQTSFETVASKAAQLGFIGNHSYISLRQTNLTYSR
ncbi:MAG: hypothetical protein Q7T54_01175 [Candidatus Levybacteria bacterium]|nr:hypothetical protein [Candidatus Levybacteria bacterium]